MPSFKNNRMSEDIHRELPDIIRQLKDPRIGSMLSVVRVDLAGDGSHCKVYISSLLGEEDTKQSVKGLRSAAGFVRRELFARLKMRKSPEIEFIADNSIAKGAEISRKLQNMEYNQTETEDEDAED
ncbi:MAG: 30S ribosome-binding factor RbfA [Oscillospiraceae bacterium]|nr:30S ribosome-binding factor RbfA [Ruminococcus sp.]MBQ7002665.1 30S ribosome-binding factor RbfA [Oscillospiraceae bacterium]MBQ7013367.1 30S ribosome-binding factor RbfA [Oscillospiraceae bacterium]